MTERGAVVHLHGLHGVALAACRRIPRVAGLTDDLVDEVTEPAAVRERATGLAIERRHGRGTVARFPFGSLSARIRPHAREISPWTWVEKPPQAVGLDRGESAELLKERRKSALTTGRSNIYRLGKCGVRYCSSLAPAGRPLPSNAFAASWRDVQPDQLMRRRP
jgi:hypothetical protein